MKNVDETRNYFIEEINQNDLMSKKYKKVCTALHFIEHLLILPSAVTGSVSISAFASLVGIPIGIKSSALGLKNCVITIGVKKYNSIIKKKRKKHDEMVLLGKTKLKRTEILISRVLINSYISHDEFVSVNNVLKEYDIKKAIKNQKISTVHQRFKSIYKTKFS